LSVISWAPVGVAGASSGSSSWTTWIPPRRRRGQARCDPVAARVRSVESSGPRAADFADLFWKRCKKGVTMRSWPRLASGGAGRVRIEREHRWLSHRSARPSASARRFRDPGTRRSRRLKAPDLGIVPSRLSAAARCISSTLARSAAWARVIAINSRVLTAEPPWSWWCWWGPRPQPPGPRRAAARAARSFRSTPVCAVLRAPPWRTRPA
jgi:hypothetical protein